MSTRICTICVSIGARVPEFFIFYLGLRIVTLMRQLVIIATIAPHYLQYT